MREGWGGERGGSRRGERRGPERQRERGIGELGVGCWVLGKENEGGISGGRVTVWIFHPFRGESAESASGDPFPPRPLLFDQNVEGFAGRYSRVLESCYPTLLIDAQFAGEQ